MPRSAASLLLVEGSDDLHVVQNLWKRHQLPHAFEIESTDAAEEGQGIRALLENLPVRLKDANLRKLGIVVDADQNLEARWQSVRDRLRASGYSIFPERIPVEGWITTEGQNLPRVGVWLMPNNQLTGMLENFAAFLIPENDALRLKADGVLQDIEQMTLNRYQLVHHPKAFIHTWLAWQKRPGMPMGQAITAKALNHDSPLALTFVVWLKRLFEIP